MISIAMMADRRPVASEMAGMISKAMMAKRRAVVFKMAGMRWRE